MSFFGRAYRTAPELTSRGSNISFARTWMDWVPSPSAGGPEEVRTLDLTDANRTLSQLSYGPILQKYYKAIKLIIQEVKFILFELLG